MLFWYQIFILRPFYKAGFVDLSTTYVKYLNIRMKLNMTFMVPRGYIVIRLVFL